ncbi:hypothetical protein evm_010586 [Chilo suppressalis]|nr:hypothetical protein evm_010586 [Chilo suppressalis]
MKPSTSNNLSGSFHEVSLPQTAALSESDSVDFLSGHEMDNQRKRRLSNSSFASDVSFRLPSYESPSMYHLQSDMEVSASEAEERVISSGTVSLDRVTKEQLYAAYRRTQDRYTKYRTQYADLARHYKLLERENAKARSVLVETQDKALRRISELREQCTLEQSAKAHLEKALRIEIEEKTLKIEALSTKITLLQNMSEGGAEIKPSNLDPIDIENDVQLINLSADNTVQQETELSSNEVVLNNKIEKMEQLINKYKESLKSIKEKNAHLTTELKILSTELDNKQKEIETLTASVAQISEANQKIQELNVINEELQNKINSYDFSKSREISTLELDLQKSQEEIGQLQSKIEVFSKREEEYAISLAENKLSIHKELEGKEAEIKRLKDSLTETKKELQSLNIIANDYKTSIANLEEERSKLNNEVKELNTNNSKLKEIESQFQILTQKCQSHELLKTKVDEEYKCLQLQMNQETAEKLAMIDRNTYLENRITQLSDENSKKSNHIRHLEMELQKIIKIEKDSKQQCDEVELWKAKYSYLEGEIQEEREELIKLQTEIEKLLANHESVQNKNSELLIILSETRSENDCLRQKFNFIKKQSKQLINEVKLLHKDMNFITDTVKSLKDEVSEVMITQIKSQIVELSSVSEVYGNSKDRYDNLEKDNMKLKEELLNAKEMYKTVVQNMNTLKDDNDKLNTLIPSYDSKISSLEEDKLTLSNKNVHCTDELGKLKHEKEQLMSKLQEVETLCNRLQNSIDHDKSQYLTALDKLKLLEDEKQTLQKRLNNLEKENELINIEVEKLKLVHKDDIARIEMLNTEKLSFNEKSIENKSTIQKLEQKVQILLHENGILKDQSESIANSLKELELEINEVRKSHTNIEAEKDRLSSIIEDLEKREQQQIKLSLENKDTQTQIVSESENIKFDNEAAFSVEQNETAEAKNNDYILSLLSTAEALSTKNAEYEEENRLLKDNNVSLTIKLKELNSNMNNNGEKTEDNMTEKYLTISNKYDSLKEDNRRLQSDIEGLQTYLAKISKENCVLNDKMRELIATSENSFGKSNMNSIDNEFVESKNELVECKEKIDDLIRENTLLVEENLELKDQLQSQNFTEPKQSSDIQENNSVTIEKYNNLLTSKNNIEEKFINLEQINKSVNGNMQQLQNNNEKLRLTNEKLERRLDEALVSLRHLHSLQENTELEYLRNILYEYLTGSGTHSITLAKVLAAVVKFDDKQTQNILQKEKERQGLLRQLGLL